MVNQSFSRRNSDIDRWSFSLSLHIAVMLSGDHAVLSLPGVQPAGHSGGGGGLRCQQFALQVLQKGQRGELRQSGVVPLLPGRQDRRAAPDAAAIPTERLGKEAWRERLQRVCVLRMWGFQSGEEISDHA